MYRKVVQFKGFWDRQSSNGSFNHKQVREQKMIAIDHQELLADPTLKEEWPQLNEDLVGDGLRTLSALSMAAHQVRSTRIMTKK